MANKLPKANKLTLSCLEDHTLTIILSGLDQDGTVTGYSLSSLPSNGTLFVDSATTQIAVVGFNYPTNTFYFIPATNFSGAASFSYNVRDNSGGLSASPAVVTINVAPVNDAPTLDLNGSNPGTSETLLYTPGNGATRIAPLAAVADFDSANFGGGTLQVSIQQNKSPTDQLGIVGDASLSVSKGAIFINNVKIGSVSPTLNGANGSDLLISLTNAATPAQASSLLEHITYSNSTANPSVAPRTVLFTLVDGDGVANGGADMGTGSATINIPNRAPVNTVPGAQTAVEDTSHAINGLSINDPDAGTGILTTTLSVSHGSLVVAAAAGATVSGSGSQSVTITGTVSQINATLGVVDNLNYLGVHNYNGSDALTVTTNDGGNSGFGGAQSDTDVVAITVNPAPEIISLSDLEQGILGFAILGEHQYDSDGYSVSSAGDVNGDGIADLLVGSYQNSHFSDANGAAYVILGDASWSSAGASSINLSDVALGSHGLKIVGENPGSTAGYSVSIAGDVNGDGNADILVGSFGSHAAYLVFGQDAWSSAGQNATINLDDVALGTGGVKLIGENGLQATGWCVSGAGDVNGDGFADMVINAPDDQSGAGAAYVVFGKNWVVTETNTSINLGDIALGNGGFKILGEQTFDNAGWSVSNGGDFNGDGVTDLLIGSRPFKTGLGAAYVVLGNTDWSASASNTNINLSDVSSGTFGVKIIGEGADFAGYSVSNAGDVNGDGIDDILVGAILNDAGGHNAGAAYVVFGNLGWSSAGANASVNLDDVALGTGGFKIVGVGGTVAGQSVSSAGDVNGDGLSDILVGTEAGGTYLVFGKSDTSSVHLGDINDGVWIVGDASNRAGWSVSGGTDVNGDGLADILVGAPGDGNGPGDAYVLFGQEDWFHAIP
ncbi:Integrins alpha chain [Mesorhizobium loti]|nr:Integrins alpha chain [Mesorhizobium loti]